VELETRKQLLVRFLTFVRLAPIIKEMIADTSDEGLSCWQVAPFAGVFTSKERWEILTGRNES
jgi:hypothetical protein